MTGISEVPNNDNIEPGREEGRASPAPDDLMDQVNARSKQRHRDVLREMRKHAMGGAAFGFGKEAWDQRSTWTQALVDFIKRLSEN